MYRYTDKSFIQSQLILARTLYGRCYYHFSEREFTVFSLEFSKITLLI